eukprot:TRINITY_DN26213_c0_g1_i1.p1 TRINITY_DN26213_c0_g1~~TRINITY_DN26213_c0_g1_i1.p1  ORF type:complete len:259 (-),score=22.38 TRINITY_DN26213_c0_g1_i1:104-880(-)
MAYPPITLVILILVCMLLLVLFRATVLPQAARSIKPSFSLLCLRCVFIFIIIGTLYSSYHTLRHVEVCDDSGERCFRFEGGYQFSTFTRWCWMLEGVYFAVASLNHFFLGMPRLVQVLFGMSLSSAVMVTTITYGVLVPGAVFMPLPKAKQGAVTILLSYQGHIMHSLNLVFILSDMWISGQTMQLADMPFGISWGLTYLVFEWIFQHFTGVWHYPFLNYTLPFTLLIHLLLLAVLAAYWYLGCKLSGRLNSKDIHTS